MLARLGHRRISRETVARRIGWWVRLSTNLSAARADTSRWRRGWRHRSTSGRGAPSYRSDASNRSSRSGTRTSRASGRTSACQRTSSSQRAHSSRRGPTRCGNAVPQPDACGRAGSGGRTTATASAACPLIACTAPHNGTRQRCRLCRGRNVPTLRSRAPLPDVTAAAPKGTFE